MIFNLQALRFLAALAVVYYHTGFGVLGVSTEFGAVSVFFVISGFIMTMITRDSADRFFKNDWLESYRSTGFAPGFTGL